MGPSRSPRSSRQHRLRKGETRLEAPFGTVALALSNVGEKTGRPTHRGSTNHKALLWFGSQWSTVWADIREQLHHLLIGFTAVADANERVRCRLVANGWHAGVVRFFATLLVTVLAGFPQPAGGSPLWPNPNALGASRLDQTASLVAAYQVKFAAPQRRARYSADVPFEDPGDPEKHLELA